MKCGAASDLHVVEGLVGKKLLSDMARVTCHLTQRTPCAAGSLCILVPGPTPLAVCAQVPNLMQSSDLVPIYENIRTRAKQAGMDQNKDQLYSFFVQEVGPHTGG